MNSQNGEGAVSCIENEIMRYRKCVHIRGIVNHGEYIAGMIDLAARLELITKNEAILLRDKSINKKKKFLEKCNPIKTLGTRDNV